MSHKRGWAQEVHGGGNILWGNAAHVRGANYYENRAFFAPKGHGDRVQSLAISAAYETNSLLSGSMKDQWNFFADQQILRALTIE